MLDNFHQSGGFAGAWAACENDFFDIAHSDFESNGELKFKFRHFLRIHPIITPKFTEPPTNFIFAFHPKSAIFAVGLPHLMQMFIL